MPFDFGSLHTELMNTFGHDATYTPSGGSPIVVRIGIIDGGTSEASQVGNVARIMLPLGGLGIAPARGDSIVINAVTYRVQDVTVSTSNAAHMVIRRA